VDSKKWIALGALLALLAAAGAWWRLGPAPASPAPGSAIVPARLSTPTLAQLLELQAQADAACRCERSLPEDPRAKGCWGDFERNLARYEHSDWAAPCMDESRAGACFPPFDDSGRRENCVLTERPYRSCSDEEAIARRAQARASGKKGCAG
jgi:hypothetical protein